MPLRFLLSVALLLAASAGFAHEGKPPAVLERALEVKQGAVVVAKWTAKDVAAWKAMPDVQVQGGKAKQYALADVLPAGAELIAVVVSTGQRVVIDDKWTRAGHAVLWQNRRGLFKLGWVDAKGVAVANAPELRDVVVLELAPLVPSAIGGTGVPPVTARGE